MSYRQDIPKPNRHPVRNTADVTTPADIILSNGQIAYMAYPCFYYEAKEPYKTHHHSQKMHDHIGWPSPNHPGHACQIWDLGHEVCCDPRSNHVYDFVNGYHDPWHKHNPCRHLLDMANLYPIHLREEGYTTVSFSLKDAVPGLTTVCNIDEDEDWIVRVKLAISQDYPTTTFDKHETLYAIRVQAPEDPANSFSQRNDIVAHGRLIVFPAAINGGQ